MLDGTVFDTAGVVGWLKQEHGPVPVGYINTVAQWPKPNPVAAQAQALSRSTGTHPPEPVSPR